MEVASSVNFHKNWGKNRKFIFFSEIPNIGEWYLAKIDFLSGFGCFDIFPTRQFYKS